MKESAPAIDSEAKILFELLEKKCGGVGKAAELLDIPRRTYYDWKTRGFATDRRWKRIKQEIHRKLSQ